MHQYTNCPQCGDKWSKEEKQQQMCYGCCYIVAPIDEEEQFQNEFSFLPPSPLERGRG